MATNKQRREAERRRLQQQLAERRAKEVARRRFTLISSIVGTLAVVALIVIVIVATTSGGSDKSTQSRGTGSPTPTATGSPSPTPAACQAQLPAKAVKAATGATVSFNGVTVKGATDLSGSPTVTSKSTATPAKLEVKDLVVGKGAAASPSSCVDVQYVGVQYKSGAEFDSSWKRGAPAEFSLKQVVAGFTQGIGGTSGVAPMRVGGRRIMILPAALGYPQGNAQAGIAPNTPLVFVVDLLKVS